jgi:hypothetical protein
MNESKKESGSNEGTQSGEWGWQQGKAGRKNVESGQRCQLMSLFDID